MREILPGSNNPFAEVIDPFREITLSDGRVITVGELQQEVEREQMRRRARNNYLSYVQYTNPGYIAGKFHVYLCNEIDKFLNKKSTSAVDILLLSVPPQHGKSLTVTETLPSYYLGHHPRHRVVILSYSEDFAQLFGRRNREKLTEYGKELFNISLASSPNSNVEFEVEKTHGGCFSAGLLGGVGGKPSHLLIVDDPIKNRQEAESQTNRDRVWNEWLSTYKPRIQPGGKVIVIQTRWHEDDFYGRLATRETEGVTCINIPCECDDPETDPLNRELGDALAPELGRDNAWLKSFKTSYLSKDGHRAWQSLYQGHPVSEEGEIVKRSWWQYYKVLPRDLEYTSMSVDATFKDAATSDFVAIEIWGKKNKNYYLIDLINERLSFVNTCDKIREMRDRWPGIRYIYIEDKANGSAIINTLQREFVGIIPVQPNGGKSSRVSAISPAIESGHVWLPEYSNFNDIFIDQFCSFPLGKNDDMVDAATQALNRMIYIEGEVQEAEEVIRYTHYESDQLEDYNNATPTIRKELIKLWGQPIE